MIATNTVIVQDGTNEDPYRKFVQDVCLYSLMPASEYEALCRDIERGVFDVGKFTQQVGAPDISNHTPTRVIRSENVTSSDKVETEWM